MKVIKLNGVFVSKVLFCVFGFESGGVNGREIEGFFFHSSHE